MKLTPTKRIRAQAQRLHHSLRGRYWFPHLPLAALMVLGGLWLLNDDLGDHWAGYVQVIVHGGGARLPPRLLPPLLIGGGMLTMALGLVFRSRLAWVMALLLVATGVVSTILGAHTHGHVLPVYFVSLLLLLLAAWRKFERFSVAASTLFAVTSVAMLLLYATFGAYYLGADYKPAITDLVTALYYAMVTMSTVGYGDIAPQTAQAKLFTVSIIVLGVAVFATSLTAVIAPMISTSLQRIINRKGARMKRENHFVVIGRTPLAFNTWRELARRGRPVTRLLREAPASDDGELKDVDVVVGDPNDIEVLRTAGVHKAEAVLAMLDDDSENAFVVLAAKELGGGARTIVAVNDARHLSRVKRVQPDIVIAPQVLGAELTAMLLSDEPITPEFIMQSVFQQSPPEDAPAPKTPPKPPSTD